MSTWKDITGFEGCYQVSEDGDVRSVTRTVAFPQGGTRTWKSQPIAQEVDRDGYRRVYLKSGTKKKHRYVHRLVIAAFVGECPRGMEACHNNGDAGDNRLSNLRYGTKSENMFDRTRHGTQFVSTKEKCPRGHELEGKNLRLGELRKGWRACLACHRAHGYVRYHPELSDQFQRIADDYYDKIGR